MELALLPGKLVLSPRGETLGYIKCAYVNENFVGLCCLVCVDAEEEEFILGAGAIRSVGEAVIAENVRQTEICGLPCPVGKALFNAEGNFVGRCNGFEAETGTLSLLCGKAVRHFLASQLVIGEVILLPREERKSAKKVQKNVERTTKIGTKSNKKAPAGAPEERKIKGAHNAPEELQKPDEYGVLGKRVLKGVADVAEPGEKVTPALLKRAHESNKLLALTANTLTK